VKKKRRHTSHADKAQNIKRGVLKRGGGLNEDIAKWVAQKGIVREVFSREGNWKLKISKWLGGGRAHLEVLRSNDC